MDKPIRIWSRASSTALEEGVIEGEYENVEAAIQALGSALLKERPTLTRTQLRWLRYIREPANIDNYKVTLRALAGVTLVMPSPEDGQYTMAELDDLADPANVWYIVDISGPIKEQGYWKPGDQVCGRDAPHAEYLRELLRER